MAESSKFLCLTEMTVLVIMDSAMGQIHTFHRTYFYLMMYLLPQK